MKTKRILSSLLALAMTSALGACSVENAAPSPASDTASSTVSSSAPSSSAASGSAADSASSTAAVAPANITWWAFPTFGVNSGYEQQVVDAFTAAHPEIKTTVTTLDFTSGPDQLTAAITAGTAPDILFDAPARIIEYGEAGNLVSLADLFTDEYKADVKNDALLATCMGSDNTPYMYPISSSPFYMGLNKEALEKADALQYVNMEGDRAWTTDNFVKMCEALSAAGATQVPGIVYCGGQGGDQGTRALVNNLYSSSIVGADGKWNIDENGVKALSLLQDMYGKKSIDAGFDMAAADELQKFQQETCAMTFCWGTSNAKSYDPETFTPISVPFPSDDGVPELEYLVNGFCVFNNKDDAKAAASKELLKFICDDAEWGPKSAVQTGAFPVRSSFGNLYKDGEMAEEYALLASWTKYYGPYYNTKPGFSVMRPEWFNMLQRVFNNGDVQAEAVTFNTNSNKAA